MPDNRPPSSLLPPALRWAGPLLAFGYGLGGKIHRAISSPRHAGIPTICIGNITVGGTGKTPATKYFARGLVERGRRPAVLLRGYKGQASDEAVELQNALADLKIPILIGADRYASAQRAKEQGCDCVLLDDGFQHWKLARDLDIVLIDATDPFGGGHLAPWGKLREAPEGLSRAGVVIITRSDAISVGDLDELKKAISKFAPNAKIVKSTHAPSRFVTLDNAEEFPLYVLEKLSVNAFCAIGNPLAFRKTLEGLGAEIQEFVVRPDHDPSIADAVSKLVSAYPKMQVVVTEKDASKLSSLAESVNISVLKIEFNLLDGADVIWSKIEGCLKKS